VTAYYPDGALAKVEPPNPRCTRPPRRVSWPFGRRVKGRSVETRLEGIVHAERYDPEGQGKQFLGAAISCADGTVWVIDYGEQSPYHAFAGRRVVASGESYRPQGQCLIMWRGAGQLGHFRVSTMHLAEPTPDAWLLEVRAGYRLSGRLEHGAGDGGESALSFVAQSGDHFCVVNDPAGAAVGRGVEVVAYPVLPCMPAPRPRERYLWVICPYSTADLWEWRRRPEAGLPGDVYVDAASGQLRRRQSPAEPGAAADGGV
jgi:hypothetical protein